MKRSLADTGAAADQKVSRRAAQRASLLTSVESLDKPLLVKLVMQLAEQQGTRVAVIKFLDEAAASGAAPAVSDDLAAAAFAEELNAAVAKVHKDATEECRGYEHEIDEGSGTVGVVASFVDERVAKVALGALQLQMLLAARKAIGNLTLKVRAAQWLLAEELPLSQLVYAQARRWAMYQGPSPATFPSPKQQHAHAHRAHPQAYTHMQTRAKNAHACTHTCTHAHAHLRMPTCAHARMHCTPRTHARTHAGTDANCAGMNATHKPYNTSMPLTLPSDNDDFNRLHLQAKITTSIPRAVTPSRTWTGWRALAWMHLQSAAASQTCRSC